VAAVLMAAGAGARMGQRPKSLLELDGVPHKKGGVDAAMAYLTSANAAAKTAKAA
jgi:CTP:molybdopterin cytidylyltransferase MocA